MADPSVYPGHARINTEPLADTLQSQATALRARLVLATHANETLRQMLEEAAGRERLLTYEVQRRSRNLLSVIRSIHRLSLESGASRDEFAEHFEGRLDVVARYQMDFAGCGSSGVELEDVIRNELQRVHCVDGPNLVMTGPVVCLWQQTLGLMSLAIHELTTNAIKFGALYHKGRLSIDWTVTGSPDRQVLRFHWLETSVPLVAPAPRARGFGRQVIEEALPYQLGATTVFEFRPGGIACSITLPLPAKPDAAADRGFAGDAPDPLSGLE